MVSIFPAFKIDERPLGDVIGEETNQSYETDTGLLLVLRLNSVVLRFSFEEKISYTFVAVSPELMAAWTMSNESIHSCRYVITGQMFNI
jgi:hypothetical protein